MLLTLPYFFTYFITNFVLIFAALFVYVKVTPYNEIALIREGNAAVAISFGGTILGMIVPMASVIVHSVGFVDMLSWCSIALATQLFMWFVINKILGDLHTGIAKTGTISHGILLAVGNLAIGILTAACMSY